MLSRHRRLSVLFLVLVIVAAGCARQPLPAASLPLDDLGLSGQIAGFIVGLFHGFMMPFNMIASLFFDVRIYTFPNSGRLYDLGYVLGVAGLVSVNESRRQRRPSDEWCFEPRRADESNRMYGDDASRF